MALVLFMKKRRVRKSSIRNNMNIIDKAQISKIQRSVRKMIYKKTLKFMRRIKALREQ